MKSKRGSGNRPGHHRKPETVFELEEASDRLSDLFSRHGANWITHEQVRLFAQFYRLLMTNQLSENFTRLTTLREIGLKHFVDSMIVPEILSQNGIAFPSTLMDVGTGPGFPGIPLALVRPKTHFLLAEGVQRRVEFLKRAREELKLTRPEYQIDILGRNINRECFYPVNGVITRAVEEAVNTLDNCVHCLQNGALAILMKGPNCDPELEHFEKSDIKAYFVLKADIAYSIPSTPHNRRLLIFQKTASAALPDFEDLDLKWEKEFGRE